MTQGWRASIPMRLGELPLGGDLTRTDPGGPARAPIAVLGVYPALTKMVRFQGPDGPINLPGAVEQTSFQAGSSSGNEVTTAYLTPLGLTRDDVVFLDIYPYYLANTANSGKSGRSMWDNVQTYERMTGKKTAVEPRLSPNAMLELCRSMPGNEARLAEQLASHPRRLLVTLGNEAAAFVRGDTAAKASQPHLLAEPRALEFAGESFEVLHLPHPGIVMRRGVWRERLSKWVESKGRTLFAEVLSR